MVADFFEGSSSVITYISGIFAIVVSITTIITFIWGKDFKKKRVLLAISVILIAITICALTILNKEAKETESQTSIQEEDTLKSKSLPNITETTLPIKNKEITKLVEKARDLEGKTITEALNKMRQAYELLTESQKSKALIDSIKGYTDSKTQFNHYDEFFKSLNY
ncbi:hypothetical protein [Dysgonomonas reticulitermitis]